MRVGAMCHKPPPPITNISLRVANSPRSGAAGWFNQFKILTLMTFLVEAFCGWLSRGLYFPSALPSARPAPARVVILVLFF